MLKFYMNLEGIKGQKLTEPIFSEPILVCGKEPKISCKTVLLGFCQKADPFIFLFLPQNDT